MWSSMKICQNDPNFRTDVDGKISFQLCESEAQCCSESGSVLVPFYVTSDGKIYKHNE